MFKELFHPAPEPEKKDTKKSEHLKEGVSPIFACIGTRDQFDKARHEPKVFKMLSDLMWDSPVPGTPGHYGLPNDRENRDADYYGDPKDLQRDNFKNRGEDTYVISPVDELDKLSNQFANCTGVVATGREKETGRNISFFSHQDPRYFLRKKSQFIIDLDERLEELKKRSEEGTVDAVVLGGNSFDSDPTYQKAYTESIELLADEIEGVLGFEPVIVTGPKTVSGRDNAYYDTEHRRLFIERPEVGNATTESYLPSEIKEQSKKWQE